MFIPHESDELSIEIDGREFRFWTSLSLSLIFDEYSSVAFTAPFEPENATFRETFRPFSYKEVRVLLAGELLFTGTMIDVAPQGDASSRVVAVSAYSKVGVLEDANVPASAYPLEFNGLKMMQIASKLLEPFGLKASLGPGANEGSRFERVKLKPDDKIHKFLQDLAKQRGLIMGSDAEGNLVFRVERPNTGPVYSLQDQAQPVTGVSVRFSPQEYPSEVTVIAKAKHGKKGGKYTVTNPLLNGTLRPMVVELDASDPADLRVAANSRLGRIFAKACTFEIGLATWMTPDSTLWMPDQRISLTAPNCMVYEPTELVVRGVQLTRDSDKSRYASLACVLPGSFTGEFPNSAPWSG